MLLLQARRFKGEKEGVRRTYTWNHTRDTVDHCESPGQIAKGVSVTVFFSAEFAHHFRDVQASKYGLPVEDCLNTAIAPGPLRGCSVGMNKTSFCHLTSPDVRQNVPVVRPARRLPRPRGRE